MKRKNKGFTLVEVIVIIVILAILAAVLIPSMSTYINKARDKQIIANARSAYVAAQTLASECYGLGQISEFNADDYSDEILKLAQLRKDGENADEIADKNIEISFGVDSSGTIGPFTYTENERIATLDKTTGSWTVEKVNETDDTSSNG